MILNFVSACMSITARRDPFWNSPNDPDTGWKNPRPLSVPGKVEKVQLAFFCVAWKRPNHRAGRTSDRCYLAKHRRFLGLMLRNP